MASRVQRQHAFAADRILPGLGFASGAVRHSLRGGLFIFPRRSRERIEPVESLCRKSGARFAFGDVFDDAATGQGLLNFFLRGMACGAITEAEALATGLTLDEMRSRSFLKILQSRRK